MGGHGDDDIQFADGSGNGTSVDQPRSEVTAMRSVENGTPPARISGETRTDDPQVRSSAQSLADGDSSPKGAHELQEEQSEAPVNEAGRTRLESDERDSGEPKVEVAQEPTDTSPRQPQSYQLHEAIEDANIQLIYQLLENGAELEQPTETGSKPLYLATELGSPDIVALLLQAGANVESSNPDAEVCSTALQQAVDRNRMEIAECLLQHGADVNSIGPSGGTPLLMAINNRAPEMVGLLLRYGADKDVTDRSGATPFELAQGSEQITALLQEPQLLQGPMPANKQAPQKHPWFVKGARAPRGDRDKMIALHGFRATVVDFFIVDGFESRLEQSMSVYKLLYGSQKVMETPQSGILKGRKRDFRWYHLPANNVEWVEDLIQNRVLESQTLSGDFKAAAGLTGSRDRYHFTATNPSAYMRPTSFSFNISPSGEEVGYDQIVAFAPYLHFETQSIFNDLSASINWILQTGAKKSESKPKTDTAGTGGTADPSDPTQWPAADSKTLYSHLLRGYLTPKSPGEPGALQTRRTLDQYFYTHLDTGERDKDQVVYRYTRDVMYSQDPKLFMVDQLWIWVIDQDTIISCAPTSIGDISMDDASIRHAPRNRARPAHSLGIRGAHVVRDHHGTVRVSRPKHRTRQWVHLLSFVPPAESGRPPRENQVWPGDEEERDRQNEYESFKINQKPLNIQHNISRYLRRTTRAQIKSPHELANLIVNHCASVFADHDIPAEYQFFDFFERSIGRVSDRVAHLLKLFQRAAHANFHDVEPQLNIQEEAKLLVEIEDIHDELIILRMVLKDQETVTAELGRFLDPPGSDQNQQPKPYARHLSAKENRLLKSHLQRIDNMEKMTQKTAKTLRSLLDLKQKQASIAEALSSVNYAKQSVEQAEETARQGRTLTLFTVVTIVFLPLSFLAAFFAIEIDVFPVDANGKLSLDYVLKYLLGISAGLSVPFIFIAFNQDRVAGWVALVRRHIGAALIVAALILFAVLLIVVLTSSLDSMVKVGAAVATALLGLFGVIAFFIFKLGRVAKTVDRAETTARSSSVAAY